MERHVLRTIPFQVDFPALVQRMRLRDESSEIDELRHLVEEAESTAQPKAMYAVASIESKSERGVVINGTDLTSRVLRVNLDAVHRVFPFVATCGAELDGWGQASEDRLLHRFWADEIKELALRAAIAFLGDHLAAHYFPGKVSHMNPGSLADWPLRQQRPLFAVLGDPQEEIGVRLTDSLLMVPMKSVSGIIFPVEVTFESCQLCQMQRCPNRRAPYDAELHDSKYRATTSAEAVDFAH
jgi:hypothetical protein